MARDRHERHAPLLSLAVLAVPLTAGGCEQVYFEDDVRATVCDGGGSPADLALLGAVSAVALALGAITGRVASRRGP